MSRRSIFAAAWMLVSLGCLVLSILEISFPSLFSVSMRIDALLRYRMQIGLSEAVLAGFFLWPAFRLDGAFSARLLETASRLGIGGMFIVASWFKIQDPQGFALLVAQYQFLPQWSVNLFSLFIPQLELCVGFAFVFTRWNKEMALLLAAMFVAFILALAQAVWRDLGITCGCFEIAGALSKKDAWISLVRDLILVWPTLWLVTRPNRTLVGIWRSGSRN